MADSIRFTIGGQLGASYKGALAQAERESIAANSRMLAKLKAQQLAYQVEMKRLGLEGPGWANAGSAQASSLAMAAEHNLRAQNILYAAAAKKRIAAAQEANAAVAAAELAMMKAVGSTETAMREKQLLDAKEKAAEEVFIAQKALEEKLAAEKAYATQRSLYNVIALGQIAKEEEAATAATLLNVARGYGSRASGAGGAHGAMGISGIIRESMVIVRELAMGRGMGRVAGSVTLLAQYLGLLGKVVKSTAAEALNASIAESKLSQSMAKAALMARGKVNYSELAAAAMNQEAKAAKAAEEAEIALASAKTAINPLGWALIAGAAITAVLVGWAWHLHKVREEAKRLTDNTDNLHKKFTDLASAEKEAAGRHQEYLDFLKKIGDQTETLEQQTDRLIKKFKEQSQAQIELARAKGMDKMAIEKLEEAQLREELRLTTLAKLAAKRQEEDAADKLAEADKAYNSSGDAAADVQLAQNKLKNQGEIVDALQTAMETATVTTLSDKIIGSNQGVPVYAQTSRQANETDVLSVKTSFGEVQTSLADAKKKFNEFTTAVKKMEMAQKNVADTYNNAKSTLEERHRATQKFTEAEQELQDQLGIKTTLGREIAAAGGKGRINATDWERAGGAFGGHGMSMLDIGKQQLTELKHHSTELKQIHEAVKKSSRGVQFQ